MSLPKPHAILFDWDNTLVDSWPVIYSALHDTFVDMGHQPWTLEETKQRVAASMRDSFPAMFGQDWEKAGKIYQTHYRARHLEGLKSLPQAAELLEYLTGHDIYRAIVSNKRGETLRKEAEVLGWTQHFSKLIGSDDAGKDKPAPDPVWMALAGTGIDPKSHTVWLVGDSSVDLECAAATGCVPVFFGLDRSPAPSPSPPGPGEFEGRAYAWHTADHNDLIALLRKVL